MKIFGFHPVREALRSRPEAVRRVVAAGGRGGERRREIEALCRPHDIPFETTPRGLLDALAGDAAHNGFLAEVGAEAEDGSPVRDELAATGAAASGGDRDLAVLVEDVQDPRNLGALLRVCEGAGVGRVFVRDRGSAPLSPAAVKTSAGAAEWVNVERVTNSSAIIRRLKEEGYWVYGTEAGGRAPWEIDLQGKVLLVLGGEEKGMRRLTRDLCDELIGLPMRGRVGSLNLATAAAAVLYDAVRQRNAGRAHSQGGTPAAP